MSKILKGIGKVFKKVVKVAKIVVPIALAAAAVVFTGGAALGLLPTFSAAVGGVAASLGLGTALTGALTGAVVGAGFGSAIGGLTSGLSGGSIIKGMQKGALTGALTGGITGAVSPSTFGIVKGLDSAGNTVTTTMNALKNSGNAFAAAGSKTALTTGADGITRLADSAAPSLAKATSVSKDLAQGIGSQGNRRYQDGRAHPGRNRRERRRRAARQPPADQPAARRSCPGLRAERGVGGGQGEDQE